MNLLFYYNDLDFNNIKRVKVFTIKNFLQSKL